MENNSALRKIIDLLMVINRIEKSARLFLTNHL